LQFRVLDFGFFEDGERGVEFAFETFQVATQISSRLIPQFAVFFESFADHALEFSRKVGIEAHRRDRQAIHDRFENYDGFEGHEAMKTRVCRFVDDAHAAELLTMRYWEKVCPRMDGGSGIAALS